jgi:hypothetical protein
MSNGANDFVLAYYNPDARYDAAAHETRDSYNRAACDDGRAKLPQWQDVNLTIHYTLDGLHLPADYGQPDGTPLRVVNDGTRDVTLDNMNRKGAHRASGAPDSYGSGGKPRADFANNITVPKANYLVSALGVREFRNTNILGDWQAWSGRLTDFTDGRKNLTLVPSVNIALIGDYGNIYSLGSSNITGVFDLKIPQNK